MQKQPAQSAPKYYVLYQLQAGKGTTCDDIKMLDTVLHPDPVYIDLRQMKSYATFFAGIAPQDIVVICGGDGTLNRFINDTAALNVPNEILYFPIGTGNDYARDRGFAKWSHPFATGADLQRLPTVQVQGKCYRFLNAVGYGIDGYCCVRGEALRHRRAPNYTAIAIGGLLGAFRPCDVTVTVDGETHHYRKAYLAPTLWGRYYGGGMLPAPAQRRDGPAGTLSVMVMHGAGRLRTLCMFPGIFTGRHVRHKRHVHVHTGHVITVAFARPMPLQIDGEVLENVTQYTAYSPTAWEKRT